MVYHWPRTLLSVYLTPEKSTLRDIKVIGEKPGPLCNASLNGVAGTKLYLFGGLNRETGWNNDMWSFDTGKIIVLLASPCD
jgi:hypothetical protein